MTPQLHSYTSGQTQVLTRMSACRLQVAFESQDLKFMTETLIEVHIKVQWAGGELLSLTAHEDLRSTGALNPLLGYVVLKRLGFAGGSLCSGAWKHGAGGSGEGSRSTGLMCPGVLSVVHPEQQPLVRCAVRI